MAVCPFTTYRPISVNHGGLRTAHKGFVVHDQEGNGSLFGWFSNPAAEVSAHFWVPKVGTPEQYYDTDVVAWAEENGNDSYAACEFEGFAAEAMNSSQLLWGARIAKWLAGIEGWPIVGPVPHGAEGITSHCNLDGSPDPAWGDHPCPGPIRLAQIPAIVWLASPPPSPPTPQEDDMSMVMSDPESGKVIATDPDGNFYADPGIGDIKITTLSQHPEWKAGNAESAGQNPCIGIVPWKDPSGRWGYAYVTKPASGHGSLGPYSTYHIGRDGTPH